MDNSGLEKPIPGPPAKEDLAEKRDADAGAVPGRVAVVGRRRVSEPGKSTLPLPDCPCEEPGGAGNGWMCCWPGEAEREAETTAARGGRDREFGSASPPEVGGRLALVRGRPSRVGSETPKLTEEAKGRKDWPGAAAAAEDEEVAGGPRKDWWESRKEWLLGLVSVG